jgi:hypothetical protein
MLNDDKYLVIHTSSIPYCKNFYRSLYFYVADEDWQIIFSCRYISVTFRMPRPLRDELRGLGLIHVFVVVNAYDFLTVYNNLISRSVWDLSLKMVRLQKALTPEKPQHQGVYLELYLRKNAHFPDTITTLRMTCHQ